MNNRLTDGMKWALVLTLCAILFGTAICVWVKVNPDTRTPEQKKADAYYSCVQGIGTEDDHATMTDCNAIQ